MFQDETNTNCLATRCKVVKNSYPKAKIIFVLNMVINGAKTAEWKVVIDLKPLKLGHNIASENIMDIATINEIEKSNADDNAGVVKTIKELEAKGYIENFVPNYDHFVYGNDKIELYAYDIFFDEVIRFEDLSAPEGQAILYAISSPTKNVKGIYVESYGLYHDDLSSSMIERMKFCHDLKRGTLNH